MASVDKDFNDYLHYVRKSDITRSMVEGTESRALCGEWFVAFGLTGRLGKPGLADVCPPCLAEYAALPSGRSKAVADDKAAV